jgi:flagellar hook protein FlgE
MAISQSLFSAISGLINHQTRLDNIGNNLANINTVGYKRSALRFQDVLSQTVRGGSSPDGTRGGTNPLQLGLGMQVASVTAEFNQGGLEATGNITDLALEGDGFFKVVAGDVVRYTRDGNFSLGQDRELVTSSGYKVHGWNADLNGIIDTTSSTEAIIIPLGEKRIAKETDNVYYTGNLNSDGITSNTGTVLDSAALASDAIGTAATGATNLNTLYYWDGSSWTRVFSGLNNGDSITLQGLKGSRTVSADISYVAGANPLATTLTQLRLRIDEALGLQTIAGGVDAAAGVTVAAGVMTVTGNAGEGNALSQLEFVHNNVTTSIFTETTAADGESGVTSTIVYDSLGNEHLVTLTASLIARDNNSSTWRWYADAADDTDLDLAVGTGTVQFDTAGQFLTESGDQVRVDLDLLGVSTQLVINPDFENITQFASLLGSELNVRSQDGAPMGVLDSFAVSGDGTVSGLFTNGLTTDLAKITVTRFSNNSGLLRDAQNMFSAGNNSGLAQDGEALEGGRGAVRAGTLESSNVDIAVEFTDLIVTQRGFQANARTVTASDEMLIELINLTR